MKALVGTGAAIITPFTNDGSLDLDGLRRTVNHCIDGGLDYLVVLGTTGESATLNSSEKQLVRDTVVDENDGRVPLVVGIGGNNTAAVVNDLTDTDLRGFTAVLSVSPYYNKPTQEGIYRHFAKLSSASSKPIIIYNVPGRTASNILPETVRRIAENCPNIIGIKEACGDMVQIQSVIKSVPSDFLVISGDDSTALPTALAGGAGVISVIAQGLPSEFSKMMRLGMEGRDREAYSIHNRLKKGMDLIFEEGNPAGIKAMLECQQVAGAQVRLPLVEATESLKSRISEFVDSTLKLPA